MVRMCSARLLLHAALLTHVCHVDMRVSIRLHIAFAKACFLQFFTCVHVSGLLHAFPAGCCFLFGGIKFKTQAFNAVANQATSSLLFLSCIGIIIPTAAVQLADGGEVSSSDLLNISRGTAVIMLLV